MNRMRHAFDNINTLHGPLCALYLLGPVRLCTQDERLICKTDWSDDRQLALFIYLVLNRDHITSAMTCQHQFWPYLSAKNVDQEITAVSQTLSHLFNLSNPILWLDGGYQLKAGISFWIDIDEFDKLIIQAANEPHPTQQISLLQQAVSLYRGDFLSDLPFNQTWITAWRTHFQQGHLAALQRLNKLYERVDDSETARQIQLNALRARRTAMGNGRSFIHLDKTYSSTSQSLRQCKRLISLLQNELEILLEEGSSPLDIPDFPTNASPQGGRG